MSPKRGDRVAPPPTGDEWDVRFSTSDAVKGWLDLCRQAPGNTRDAWETMRADPGPGPGKPTSRHHQLKGTLATGRHSGRVLPMWQLEVTGGGRIWYLVDAATHTIWMQHAGTGHPKATD